jgi:hypothetical protein
MVECYYFLAPIAVKILLFFPSKTKRLQRIAGLAPHFDKLNVIFIFYKFYLKEKNQQLRVPPSLRQWEQHVALRKDHDALFLVVR